jgi:hypothetical protein
MSDKLIKSKFVDVITDSTLLSTTTAEPLTTVVTERTVIDVSSNSSSSTPEYLTPQQLIDRYDSLFTTPEMYREFVKQKLDHWKDQTDLRYFDTIYQNHRRTKHTIKGIQDLAQTLLEEANQLQTTHNNQLTDLYSFIPNITQPHLQKHLGNPELVYPKPRTQVICRIPQISSTTIPPPVQPPIVSTSRPNPTPRTTPIRPKT